jgi:hypothetical protein
MGVFYFVVIDGTLCTHSFIHTTGWILSIIDSWLVGLDVFTAQWLMIQFLLGCDLLLMGVQLPTLGIRVFP